MKRLVNMNLAFHTFTKIFEKLVTGHSSDFPTWSELGTNCGGKPTNVDANFAPSYLWTGKGF